MYSVGTWNWLNFTIAEYITLAYSYQLFTHYSLPPVDETDLGGLQKLEGTPLQHLEYSVPEVATPLGALRLSSVLSYHVSNDNYSLNVKTM